jgi:hypothetical protein
MVSQTFPGSLLILTGAATTSSCQVYKWHVHSEAAQTSHLVLRCGMAHIDTQLADLLHLHMTCLMLHVT